MGGCTSAPNMKEFLTRIPGTSLQAGFRESGGGNSVPPTQRSRDGSNVSAEQQPGGSATSTFKHIFRIPAQLLTKLPTVLTTIQEMAEPLTTRRYNTGESMNDLTPNMHGMPRTFLSRGLHYVDPAKILIFLQEEERAQLAMTCCGCRDGVAAYNGVLYAKMEARPHYRAQDWWRLGVASRGIVRGERKGENPWMKLVRKLTRISPSSLAIEGAADLTEYKFGQQYEQPRVPVLIRGGTAQWRAAETWTSLDELVKMGFGDQLFRFNDLHGEEIMLKDFVTYARSTQDDCPIGLYDSQFGVSRNDERLGMGGNDDYDPPPFFGGDVFEAFDAESRPPHRWILIGLPRGGTEMHVDPLCTSAWVALLAGRKRWVMFPPDFDSKSLGGCNSSEERCADIPTAYEWFSKWWNTPATQGGVEILQQPGEIVFVPSGWKHIVINLDETIAITHNYASKFHMEAIMTAMKQSEPELCEKLIQVIG